MNAENSNTTDAMFSVGQVVIHSLFHYRGVIVDVDPCFQGSEEWYERVALTRPPRERPWYRVLVHNSISETYVAERNLESDTSGDPVNHPMVKTYFGNFKAGCYPHSERLN